MINNMTTTLKGGGFFTLNTPYQYLVYSGAYS